MSESDGYFICELIDKIPILFAFLLLVECSEMSPVYGREGKDWSSFIKYDFLLYQSA